MRVPRTRARSATRTAAPVLVLALLLGPSASAQTPVPAPVTANAAAVAVEPISPDVGDAPAAPIAPAVITRGEDGRATLRAIRLSQPLRIDGLLDESLYEDVPAISDFIQMEPQSGAPATEKTEAWVAFDADNVYVSFRAWDSQMETLIATEMRRDGTNNWQGNDIVSFIFDTFYDRRNSLTFTINPLGGRSDGQLMNERQFSNDWNPVWRLKTGRFPGGWTVETAIPFKSIRYRTGAAQLWGFNAMRVKRAKNEVSTITRVPPARGQQAFQQASYAATLVGVEAPVSGRPLDLKPYATSSVTTDRAGNPSAGSDPDANAGLDLKYAVTQGLTGDVTVNTDFAQVEADEQQVNLTRFSLFFPEKRDFFLENANTFSFGGVAVTGATDAPILFYSRRIGLNQGGQVPLEVGGRLTGRAGRYSIGMLNIQTGEDDRTTTQPTNFTVMRVKRDILRRSSVGVLMTNRSVGVIGGTANRAYGLDATLSFFENLQIQSYWAKTETGGLRGRNDSYRAALDYSGDRYQLQAERLGIGDNFNPEVGFVRRDNMVRDYGRFRFSPRPARKQAIRKYVYEGAIEYIENGTGRLETRHATGEFALEFQSADRLSVLYTDFFEYLPAPFRVGGNVTLPVGGYDFETLRLGYNISQQRTLSANLSVEYGTFYNGHKTSLSIGRGRIVVSSQLSFEPTYSINAVTLDQGRFTTHLLGNRTTYTVTPQMFVSALVQYNSDTKSVSTNARLRWEYQPGSELFVVYNDDRNTQTRGFPSLSTRALIVKVNRLFRF
jgi:hypothetical protein